MYIILVHHYSLLFPFLLPLLIFCSHSSFLSPYSHTLNLQSISVSCTSWSYSVIMLWTQLVFCCVFTLWVAGYVSARLYCKMSGDNWVHVERDTHSEHVCWYVKAPPTVYMCTYCQIPHLLSQTPWLHPLILCGFFLRVTTDYSWEWNSPNFLADIGEA